MVAYCSIMTLLLAFFIILQAFAKEQREGLFHAGQGSFKRALRTFGLGGVLGPEKRKLIEGRVGPHYRAPEGASKPPPTRRIDPEMEEAQAALQSLEDQFELRDPEKALGHRVELSTPFSYRPAKAALTEEEKRFVRDLAPRLERVLLARGFVVRIGAVLRTSADAAIEETSSALGAANRVRELLIEEFGTPAAKKAGRRMYSFLRWEAPAENEKPAAVGQLKIDVVLTKPYQSEIRQRGGGR